MARSASPSSRPPGARRARPSTARPISRPTSARRRRRANFRSPAACNPPCTAGGCGRCASTPASAPPPSRTPLRYLLEQGQTGLSVAFDLPTQMGYDPDHPLAEGEVGKVGVAIGSLDDMATLFEGIPLDRVSTSMTINATAAILLALYIAVGRAAGRAAERSSTARCRTTSSRSTSRAAPTSTRPRPSHAARSPTSSPTAPTEVPQWNTISISGYHIREAGSHRRAGGRLHPRQRHRLRQAALDAGLDVDAFAPQLAFFFNAHNDLLEEIAKFRAARRLWARIMRERFGAGPALADAALPHADRAAHAHRAAAGEQHRARDPAGAGGRAGRHAVAAHQLHGRGAAAAHRARPCASALRTQQIIAYETRRGRHRRSPGRLVLHRAPDRRDRARRRRRTSRQSTSWAARWPRSAASCSGEIQDARLPLAARGGAQARGSSSASTSSSADEPPPTNLFQLDPAVARAQLAERLGRLRRTRDTDRARRALDALEPGAAGPRQPDAAAGGRVEASARWARSASALRAVFGVHQPSVTF